MAGRQCMKWDPVVHEDILIALFQHVTLTSEHWAKVMDELRTKGYVFSENALRYTLLPFFCFHVVFLCFYDFVLGGQVGCTCSISRHPRQPGFLFSLPSPLPPPFPPSLFIFISN
ncbi:Uncharacterized protein TPAR_05652 [Tolypocladium paradoxum]|uniref:Uncharacterized protein n=1 Tax=Tolypocladium paradoxum TaxID=94208 RepID=A0A2S4KVD1_9HYPO|nr:Uncharacterized protein TPAR_05652 [Tolypocladium paradoxum]